MAELLPARARCAADVPATTDRRRVVVRLVGDEEVELGYLRGAHGGGRPRRKDAIATFEAAESAGEWPELEGRHLRPASILSVDVLVADS